MRKAFTLVELIIVVAIIAILSVIIVVSYTGAQKKSHDTKSKADLQTIAGALQAYYSQKGSYPQSVSANPLCTEPVYLAPTNFTKIDSNGNACKSLNRLVDSNYLSAFPKDQSTAANPGYYYHSDGLNYKLIKVNPELLTGTDCQTVAGEYFDQKRPCTAYQVNSNLSTTRDW